MITRPKLPKVIRVAVAHRRPVGTREAAKSNGRYRATDMRWKFDRSYSDPEDIQIGWSVKDADGLVYRILECNITRLTAFWLLTTRNLALDYGTFDKVHIRRVVQSTTDIAGRNNKRYAFAYRDLPARIQPNDQSVTSDDIGANRLEETFTGFFLEDHGLLASDLVCLKDGRALEITQVDDLETIDTLPSIQCVDSGARWDTSESEGSVGDI